MTNKNKRQLQRKPYQSTISYINCHTSIFTQYINDSFTKNNNKPIAKGKEKAQERKTVKKWMKLVNSNHHTHQEIEKYKRDSKKLQNEPCHHAHLIHLKPTSNKSQHGTLTFSFVSNCKQRYDKYQVYFYQNSSFKHHK